ncbi:hypothetical protein ABPG72_019079 [Tetrahymena utriculariae]
MQENFQIPLGYNTDFLYPSQQNQINAQSIFSSFGQNQNTQNEKLSCQDQLNKHYALSTAIAQSDQDSCSNKLFQKGDSDLISLLMKDTVAKSSSVFPTLSQNSQNDQLIQKLGMLEIQNKEQEERIQNLQKLNDQLMSAITDLNRNDLSKQKYQREKEILQKQHEKEISDYMFQIKDLKNKLELQKSQMNEKAAEYEKDKLLLEKQLEEEEKSYQQKLQQYKEEKDSINAMLKDYEQMRQKNQEAVQANLENKIRVLEEIIEKQKQEAEERTGQLANNTEKNIQNMKQIHENEKSILMNKISSLQQEKKLIEQQSEYNFKLFTDLRNKSENQQDSLYNELDKARKLICGLEQKIIEKDSIIQIRQQKIDGNETVLKLREKNYEESLKTLKNQNDQLMEQIKKQQHELKLMQFQIQEKSFELTDKSKQLKKQLWHEKKKAEQMEEAANRIKDDYTKKNSFVIQELLMKEEKIKKLNNQIHKQSAIQNQIAQLNYNSLSNNNNNNTSYSFINNTNLSNLIQNPNLSLIQQNMSGVNRPSQRQQDRNQILSLSNNVNLNMIMNQENFNSSDNLNIINNYSLSKSPKLQVNKQINASIMSQIQDSYSVPTSNRNINNIISTSKNNQVAAISSDNLSQSNQNFNPTRIQHLRSMSNYQSENINKNNSQIQHEKSNIDNFNSCQVVNNLLSINSPSNTTTLPQITNEFMSPQSQKLDLSRSEPQTMRGLAPTTSQNQIQTMDQGKKDEAQKNKRSLSQAVTPLATRALNKSFQKVVNQQNLQKPSHQKNYQNKSGSQSPLAIQQREIIGSNLTLITYGASQQKNNNNKKPSNKEDIHNTSINTPISNKRGAVNNNQNRSVSPIHNQSVNSCYSQKEVEKTKNANNRRNISVDQSKNINKIVGVTLNSNKDFNQSHVKNLSVSATPMSSVNLNILMNQQNENIENMNARSNQTAFTPETNGQKQQITNLTPYKLNNQMNQNYSNFMHGNQNANQNNSFSKDRPNLLINLQQQQNVSTNSNTQQVDNCFSNQFQNYESNQQMNQISTNFMQNNLNMGLNQNNSFSKENCASRPNLVINLQQNQTNNIGNQNNCKQQMDNCFNSQSYQQQHNQLLQQNSISVQQKRDITFGTPITENFNSEMSQKFQKTGDDNQQLSQQQSQKIKNDQQIPIQSKIRKILNQFNFIQQAQQNKQQVVQASYNQKENQANNQQQYPQSQPQQHFRTNQKEIEAIFFQQMKEALQTYPEMIEQSNGILRTSMESKDMQLALNGLKEIIQKININQKEKKELQIEITSLQSKCSLEKFSLQNIPANTIYNYDTQNNIQNSSIGDSKVNQLIMENLQIKTSENSFCGVNISEKENAKATPVSLELNNKFKPLTSIIHNGNPSVVNNLSINLSGLKSPQFQQMKEDKNNIQSHALQQKSDYLNDYNSNLENLPYKNNLQVLPNSKNQTNSNNKSANISYYQFNSARNTSKTSNDQNQNPNNLNKIQNKHSASISITISANNCINDQSPQMQRINSGLSQTNRQAANVNNNLLNLSNNKLNKIKTTGKI